MAEGLVERGRTVEEAVTAALKKLGLGVDDVEVEVLEGGGEGAWVWGQAVVRVVPKLSERAWAERIVRDILTLMGVQVQLRCHELEDQAVIDVSCSGLEGLLIGKGGQTLSALQHVVERILWKRGVKESRVLVDIANYRRRRDRALTEKARDLAVRVKETQTEVIMGPLPPADRRVVHLALSDDPQVRTYTIGQGLLRNVVVAPTSSSGTGGAEPRDHDVDQ